MVEKSTMFVVALALVVCIALGVFWLVWLLWTWVWPQIWADGPKAFINPGYWLFVGLWVLLGLVGGMFRSGKND